MNKLHKSVLIGIGALVLSTVAIQASDVIRGVEGNLTGLVSESTGPCDSGSVQLLLGSHALCVDKYEASPSAKCPVKDPDNPLATQENANEDECHADSKKGVSPWRFVSLTQAQQFCARVGKRLPTNEEWYKAVSGITDQSSCIIDPKNSSPADTGSAECVTPSGVYDMIGNVWEWMDEEVSSGIYNNRDLPDSGYVTIVDSDGVVVQTDTNPSAEFNEDYAITSRDGLKGIIRGGFYASAEDAGIFAQNLAVPFDLRSSGVGFRCVKDI